jgi:hypothetical protein
MLGNHVDCQTTGKISFRMRVAIGLFCGPNAEYWVRLRTVISDVCANCRLLIRSVGKSASLAAALILCLLPLVATLRIKAFMATPPQTDISNGELHVKLYLPDAHNGYYRGTRFDWSGVIGSLIYKGHDYYEPWFDSVDSAVHDYRYEGSRIIASSCSGITGPAEEFQTHGAALGWDEAKPGGTFIKIGVGVLRKDQAKYDFVKQYDMVDPGKWTVVPRRDSVEFTQELTDPSSGYGYVYHKTVRLFAGKPEMVLEHRLENTGRLPIQTAVYNHNFLVLDRQPIGPDLVVTFPFPLHSPQPPKKDLAEIRGNQFVYVKVLQNEDMVEAPLEGYGARANDYDIRVGNHAAGAGVHITGDRPLSHINLWSIRTVLAVEPFVSMTIEPGGQFSWTITYEYYTFAPGAK